MQHSTASHAVLSYIYMGMNRSNHQNLTETQPQRCRRMDSPLPHGSSDKGCGSSSLEQGYLNKPIEETHHPYLEIEGEKNVSRLPTSQSNCQGTQANEPTTASHLKSILTKIFPRRPIKNSSSSNKNTRTIYPTTLEAKVMLRIGLVSLIGLLSVTYKINGDGNLVPTDLFHQPTFTFTFFLITIMIVFYFAAIGVVLEEPFPNITKVINIISFFLIVLGVTVLLWALIPNNVRWIPWIFFACAVALVFGVLVHGRFTDKSAALRSTASLGSSSLLPI